MNTSTVSSNGKTTITTDSHVIQITKKSVHINGKEVKYSDGNPVVSKTNNLMPLVAAISFISGFLFAIIVASILN